MDLHVCAMAPVCTHRIINRVLVNELILKGQVELQNVLDSTLKILFMQGS